MTYCFSAEEGTYSFKFQTYTPNKTLVFFAGTLDPNTELDSDQIQSYKDTYDDVYEETIMIGDPTRKYNCHGFAWHMYPHNLYDDIWISFDDPPQAADAEKIYWEDGSFVQVNKTINSQQKPKYSIVFYDYDDPNYEHSAYSYLLDDKTVISKWGEGILARHDYDDCQYYRAGVDIKFYIRAAQFTQFGDFGIDKLRDNSESKPLEIQIGKKPLIDVKFDNPTPNIQDNINSVKLYHDRKPNEPLIETDGIIDDFEWDLSGLKVGLYKLFAEVGYVDNTDNNLGGKTIATLYLDVKPKVEVKTVPPPANKSEYYTIDTTNYFEATCTGADGQDYPFMSTTESPMKFYYKMVGENDYHPIDEPLAKAVTTYPCSWVSGALDGDYIVKATAFYTDGETAEVYNASDSLTIQLITDAACVINNPKACTREAWDFEFTPSVIGGYYADQELESTATFITTLTDKNYDPAVVIKKPDGWSASYIPPPEGFGSYTCPQTKYHWSYYDFSYQWNYYVTLGRTGEIQLYPGSLNSYPFPSTIMPSKEIKDTGVDDLFSLKKNYIENEVADNKGRKSLEFYKKNYIPNYINSKEELKPGIYNAEVHAYNASDYEKDILTDVARPASTDFLIPAWKLKILNEDKWFDVSSDTQTGPTYLERTEYNVGEDIHLMIWRPFENYEKNSLNFKIINSKSGAIIFEKNLKDADYTTDTFITDNYAPQDTLRYFHYVWDTIGLTPGFYKIQASELDKKNNINVTQEREIQICTLYEQWENNGIWSEVWPIPSESNSTFWKIKELNGNFYCPNRYLLEAHYETGFNLGFTSTEYSVDVTNEYPAMLEVCMTANRIWNQDSYAWVWEEQVANFSIKLTKDGSEFTDVRTLNLQKDGFIDYPYWPNEPPVNYDPEKEYKVLCGINYYFPIGKIDGLSQKLKIKFNIEGLPEFFTVLPEDNKINSVHFDEIKLLYLKGTSNRPYPKNLTASQSKGSNSVSLTFEAPEIDNTGSLEKYLIYRNGLKIGETTVTSFVDNAIFGSKRYNYVVVAKYTDAYYSESSMLDCSIWYSTQEILYPRPADLKLTKGTGDEDNCIRLDWLEPQSNVLRYLVFRNDSLKYITESNFMDDYYLKNGEYSYYIKAVYGELDDEVSESSLTVSTVIYSTKLPIYEGFEHDGNLPGNWTNYSHCPYNIQWVADNDFITGIAPVEGAYYLRISGGEQKYCDPISFRTPDMDLRGYSNIILSYKFNLYQANFNSDTGTVLSTYISDNNKIVTKYCPETDTDYTISERYNLANSFIDRKTNKIWQTVSVPVDSAFSSCFISFFGSITRFPDDPLPVEVSVLIDDFKLTGINNAAPPVNIRIVNDQGFVSLTWDKVPDATAYIIYRSEYPDKNFTEIARVDKRIHGTQEIQNYYSDVVKKPGNVFMPAVNNFEKPYYYKIATVVEIKIQSRTTR